MPEKRNVDSRGKERVQTEYLEESQTVQSDGDRADITKILGQYRQVGIVDNLNMAEAQFADISEFTDFADAIRHAREAEDEFMKLPSKVREIFKHDVGEWLDTAHDEDKRDALVQAGIIEAEKPLVPPAVAAAVVDPAGAPASPPAAVPPGEGEPVAGSQPPT